jgi:hypothetical protein
VKDMSVTKEMLYKLIAGYSSAGCGTSSGLYRVLKDEERNYDAERN